MLHAGAGIARPLVSGGVEQIAIAKKVVLRTVAMVNIEIHHGHALDFGPRVWLNIDPKGLLGERTFDFVNLLRNPDDELALAPGRFAHQVAVIADAAGLDRVRLLQWTLAFTGLSAAWILGDGDEPALDLAIAELAARELGSP